MTKLLTHFSTSSYLICRKERGIHCNGGFLFAFSPLAASAFVVRPFVCTVLHAMTDSIDADDSTSSRVVVTELGECDSGHEQEQEDTSVMQALMKNRMRWQKTHVERLMMGSGIGKSARKTVCEGIYRPQATMDSYLNTTVGGTSSFLDENDENGAERGPTPCSTLNETAVLEVSPSKLMQNFGSVEVKVSTLQEVAEQLEHNIRVAWESIDRGCAPYTFNMLLDSLATAIGVIERGDPDELVRLPVHPDGGEPLCGAESVMKFTNESILPICFDLMGIIHATDWMLQYTLTFINSMEIHNEEESQLSLELSARCVRFSGEISRFTAFAADFDTRRQMYIACEEVREMTERYVGDVLDSVEKDLTYILRLQFPRRRQWLFRHQHDITQRLRLVLLIFHELETGWMPATLLQMKWKDEFLTKSYNRIYVEITPLFFSASLGFVDTSLYKQSTDLIEKDNPLLTTRGSFSFKALSRCKKAGAAPRGRWIPEGCLRNLIVMQIRKFRTEKQRSLEQISLLVKDTMNRTVGLQLCAGARYILDETDEEYDEVWGFTMNEALAKDGLRSFASKVAACFTEMAHKKQQAEST
uniref:Uncharacterized protein n=1 Tax=Trypanosoma congolense (strain IL3000) TaxID=1068625 RepID=G0UKX2_TRYCI|nr:conserved hypothetical protein [Trypanosoma congolense IL3000]